jgi:hypothetical protein
MTTDQREKIFLPNKRIPKPKLHTIFTERKGPVQLTSLYFKTSYFDEEVNGTAPSPSIGVLWNWLSWLKVLELG